jgi:hypothetical protein
MMTVRSRFAAFTAAALLALLPATGCAGGAMGMRVTQEVDTHVSQAPRTLEVHDPVGSITIDSWSRRDVQVDALKRASSNDDLRAITVSVQPQGGRLIVSADLGDHSTSNRGVDFTIHVPATTNLDVHGNVGAVKATAFSGNVDADVDVGSLKVAMTSLTGSQHVDLRTSVGEIRLTVPRRPNAAFTADTSVGNISSDVPLQVERKMVSANAHGSTGSGSAKVTLSASTGSIHIGTE